MVQVLGVGSQYFWRLVQIIATIYISCCLPLSALSDSPTVFEPHILLIPLICIMFPQIWPLIAMTLILCFIYLIKRTCPIWVLFLCGLSYGLLFLIAFNFFRVPSDIETLTQDWAPLAIIIDYLAMCWILLRLTTTRPKDIAG